jgi:phytoene desaturase
MARQEDTLSHIVVIGAGMGGMSAAARLQALGHKVVVIEQSAQYGGKLARYSKDGFVFDLGPSLFTIPSVYRDLFDRTGKPLDDAIEITAPERAFRYQFADKSSVVLPAADPGLIAVAFGKAFGSNASSEWLQIIKKGALAWQLTRTPILESPITGLSDLLKLAKRPKDIFLIKPWQSLQKLGKRNITDPRLQNILDRYATYTGSDPRKAPAALVTIPYVEQVFGAWHITGGITKLADVVYQRCVDLGVEFKFNTEILAINTELDRVSSVRTNSEEIATEIVVANCDASLLYGKLLQHKTAKTQLKKLNRTTPSLAGFILLLAVSGKTPGIAHHNIWFPANYDAEFDDIFGKSPKPVADPTIYACVPDDPQMRPEENTESWYILVNAPRHDQKMNWDDQSLKNSYAELIIQKLADRGVNLQGRIKWQQVLTPADLETRYAAPGGSIYGSSSNGAASAFLRPSNIGPVTGLYLVGGSSHPGGGLPLVGLSARIVAQLIGKAKK